MIPPPTPDPPRVRRTPAGPDHGTAPPSKRCVASAAGDVEACDRLSHELRTPLNAILGYAELLLDGSAGPLSGQARECAAHIQAAGRHLLGRVEAWQGRTGDGGAGAAAEGHRAAAAAWSSVELINLLRVRLAGAVEPHTAVLRLLGEAGRLERLADALADFMAGAGAVALAVEDRGAGASVALTLRRRPAGAAPPCGPSPAAAGVVEMLVVELGGAVERGDDGTVVLVWPSRLVLERRP